MGQEFTAEREQLVSAPWWLGSHLENPKAGRWNRLASPSFTSLAADGGCSWDLNQVLSATCMRGPSMWPGLPHGGCIPRMNIPDRKTVRSHITWWHSSEVTQPLFSHFPFIMEAHPVARVGDDSQIFISGPLVFPRFWIWSPNCLLNLSTWLIIKLHPGNPDSTVNSLSLPFSSSWEKVALPSPSANLFYSLWTRIYLFFSPKIHAVPKIPCRLFICYVHITRRKIKYHQVRIVIIFQNTREILQGKIFCLCTSKSLRICHRKLDEV